MSLSTRKAPQEVTADEPALEQAKENNLIPNGRKIPLTHRTAAKVIAFLLVIVMSLVTAAAAAAAAVMVAEDLYTTPQWSYKNDAMRNLAEGDMITLIRYLKNEYTTAGHQDAMRYLSGRNVASVVMTFSDGPRNVWTYDAGVKEGSMAYSTTWYHMKDTDSPENWFSRYPDHGTDVEQIGTVYATVRLTDTFEQQDIYYFTDRVISIAYYLRYSVYVIALCALVSAILLFVFLMCASGRKKGLPDPQPGWGTRIPFDLLTGGLLLAAFLMVEIIMQAMYFFSAPEQILTLGITGIALMAIALG